MEQIAQATTSYISLPKKVVLNTYESEEENQHFYDCSFKIPMDIPAGPTGLYSVTVNEALFYATFPILTKDDYMKIKWREGVNEKEYVVRPSQDVYSLDAIYFIPMMNSLMKNENCPFVFEPVTISGCAQEVCLTYYFGEKEVIITPPNTQFSIEYSANFGYVFNNLNKSVKSSPFVKKDATGADTNTYAISWPYLRFTGPFCFILNSNMIPEVPTVNEAGQTFNMSLLTYNTIPSMSSIVQMAGTMRCISSNITNLRFQLINDQGNPVKNKSPIYLQVSVEPYIPVGSNTQYYQNKL